MTRAQIFKLLLIGLVLIILLTIVAIFVIDRNKSPQNTTPSSTEYYLEGDKKVSDGYYHLDDTGSNIILYIKIEKIKKVDKKIIAHTNNFDFIVFDQSSVPWISLVLSKKIDLIAGESLQIKTPEELYNKRVLIEGKLVKTLIGLKDRPYGEAVINCNNKLLSFLKGNITKLECVPFIDQIIVYAKD